MSLNPIILTHRISLRVHHRSLETTVENGCVAVRDSPKESEDSRAPVAFHCQWSAQFIYIRDSSLVTFRTGCVLCTTTRSGWIEWKWNEKLTRLCGAELTSFGSSFILIMTSQRGCCQSVCERWSNNRNESMGKLRNWKVKSEFFFIYEFPWLLRALLDNMMMMIQLCEYFYDSHCRHFFSYLHNRVRTNSVLQVRARECENYMLEKASEKLTTLDSRVLLWTDFYSIFTIKMRLINDY